MHATQARVLRLPEVQNRIGLGRDSVYRLVRAGLLKAPLKISTRASGWLEQDVVDFLESRIAQRDGCQSISMDARAAERKDDCDFPRPRQSRKQK
jgi:prophage regulatory protein